MYGKTICQLNNQSRLTAPDFFKRTPGFTYFGEGNALSLRKDDADRMASLSWESDTLLGGPKQRVLNNWEENTVANGWES